MADLLPCPFCGNDEQSEIGASTDGVIGEPPIDVWRVGCGMCGASGPPGMSRLGDGKKDAIDGWNERNSPWSAGSPRDRDLRLIEFAAAEARALVHYMQDYDDIVSEEVLAAFLSTEAPAVIVEPEAGSSLADETK